MNTIHNQTWVESFNHREIEILSFISDGLSNREISQKLLLSPETIKWYNRQIFSKLGVKSRTQAVKKADEFGLLDSQKNPISEVVVLRSTNLPAQITSFVGRMREIAEIKQLLKSSRLVVLTGSGGCGKSRLAMQVANELQQYNLDGVWLVELASINDPALVVNAMIQALQVNASGDDDLLEVLKRFLERKHLLLLLDNFEHLLEAGPLVGELLATAQGMTVLATSRERLNIYGEQEYPVHPLALPEIQGEMTMDKLRACESIDLFIQRARATRPSFFVDDVQMSSIARICTRLDGLPLAIELAASQVKILPPSLLAQRLEEGLDALPSGPRDLPARQQTLRATLEWSYNLLQEEERILFARLAVFNGGSTLEGISRVCGFELSGDVIDILKALIEKNLVYPRQVSEGELRFLMLDTIHEYAEERLSICGETDRIRRLHAEYLADLGEAAAKDMHSARQEYWFVRLRDELDNLRSVFTWSLHGTENEYGLRLAASLSTYWVYNGMSIEGQRWSELALIMSTSAPPALQAGVLRSAGHIALYRNEMRKSKELLHRALELYQQLQDTRNTAWSLVYLGGSFEENPQEYPRGIALCEQALAIFRTLNDKSGMVYTLNFLGEKARLVDDYLAAQCYYEECLTLLNETRDRHREAILSNNLSFVAYHQQNHKLALDYAHRSLRVARELQNEFRQACFIATAAGAYTSTGDSVRAARLLGASHARFEALGNRHSPADQREIDLYTASARESLGDMAFEQAWRAGQSLTLQAAVALALNEIGPEEDTLAG